MKSHLLTIQVQFEQDVVLTRQRARQIAELLEFDAMDQTRIATAVSEMTRNAYRYGGGGKVEFWLEDAAPPIFVIHVRDQGQGLEGLQAILDRDQRGDADLNPGITGARRLVDQFHLLSSPEAGTTVRLGKALPKGRGGLTQEEVARLVGTLAQHKPESSVEEIQQQNQELLRTLAELRTRQGEVEHLNAELAATDRRKDEFLATLAHELRNPLAPIANVLHLLRQRGEDAATRGWICEILERQVGRMSHLLDDLLDVSRVTRGKIALRYEPLDLTALVKTTAEDHRAAFAANGLALVLDLPSEPILVHGDRTRLAQVVDNLLANAGKFTDAGGQVTLSMAPDAGGHSVSVTVRDTGIGIEPEMMSRVFESFAQADPTLDRREAGLGLGLSVVKSLVEMHGGEVHARSDGLGHGAEFHFSLPWEGATASPFTPADPIAVTFNQPLRVLVVEDSADAAETLKDLLELSGHEAVVALTGRAGVEAARAWKPDVVLCDLGLPEMDGFQVAAALRKDPALAALRLIAISGYGQEEDQRHCREAGFDLHLVKPVDFQALIQALGAARVTGTAAPLPPRDPERGTARRAP
jgi:signal transduction histidine kinase/ActR/RegA family two-component response regulator